MHYEDEARRFNLLSGLLFGTVVGSGLALLGRTLRRVRLPTRRRSPRQRLQRQLDEVRGEARKAARTALATGARRFGS